jgi:hypothetical protein
MNTLQDKIRRAGESVLESAALLEILSSWITTLDDYGLSEREITGVGILVRDAQARLFSVETVLAEVIKGDSDGK